MGGTRSPGWIGVALLGTLAVTPHGATAQQGAGASGAWAPGLLEAQLTNHPPASINGAIQDSTASERALSGNVFVGALVGSVLGAGAGLIVMLPILFSTSDDGSALVVSAAAVGGTVLGAATGAHLGGTDQRPVPFNHAFTAAVIGVMPALLGAYLGGEMAGVGGAIAGWALGQAATVVVVLPLF